VGRGHRYFHTWWQRDRRSCRCCACIWLQGQHRRQFVGRGYCRCQTQQKWQDLARTHCIQRYKLIKYTLHNLLALPTVTMMPVICTPTNIVISYSCSTIRCIQTIGLYSPSRQTKSHMACLDREPCPLPLLLSTQKSRLGTVTLASTSLGISEYNGMLRWRLSTLMSASSAIRSARRAWRVL
jgi:hypothetical protein